MEQIKETKQDIGDLEFSLSFDIFDEYENMIKQYESNAVYLKGKDKDTKWLNGVEINDVDVKPIDFKSLIAREEDKKKVIYSLFDSVLEANLESIKEVSGENYKVKIIYHKGGANILCIEDDRSVDSRYLNIKYENVNPNKCFGYTKEEIEEYLQKMVIAFLMECDK
jgi:histidinol phosphatase-like PHP family hydrolase